ncbi:MAG: TraB/GumN family protein [Gammaproteobacteria bacterium]
MGAQSRLIGSWLALVAALCAAGTAAADPAAWRIAGKQGGDITFLGSMHVLRATDYPLPATIDQLFARSDALIMELDLDATDPATQQATIMRAAMLPQGTVLRDVVDPKVYQLAEQRTRAMGIDLSLLERFEPWFLSIAILDQGMRKVGFEGERGLEQYLLRKSHEAHKPIIGLETLALQIGIFDALPPAAQQAMLEQTLNELDDANSEMAKLAAAWRDGHLETLSEGLLADFKAFPGLYETLVKNRNASWVGPLERMLGDGRHYLVVVGALHLVGRDNVIDMLKARGHKAVRLQ